MKWYNLTQETIGCARGDWPSDKPRLSWFPQC